jgi:putative DNA primase/helicase
MDEIVSPLDALRAEARRATPAKKNGNGAGHGPKQSDADIEINRLAKLSALDYERERKEVAAKLEARASILDRLVAAVRPSEKSQGQGRGVELADPEPWPSPVDGVELVSELTAAIRKYVVLSKNHALAATLWAIHCYCFDAFECTPRLAITAPEKRCGKTTLLDVVGLLVPRSLSTASISTAATFRMIEASRPTLMIDEADTFLGENEELRGVLNSGHRAGGQVIRTVGEDFEARAFSTHCPVAIAQIGKLPGTLADRSIAISMKRRGPGENVARFRLGRTPDLIEAARKAARWVADNARAIRECDPDIPDSIFNRAADNWMPLLVIAEVAGVKVSEQARQAAMEACNVEEEQSSGAMLLSDIHGISSDTTRERVTSADLVAALVSLPDRPWCECNRGKALTQNQLARRLKPYEIKPKTLRTDGERLKGYDLEMFSDSFSRYIPGFQSVTPIQISKINNLDAKQTVTSKPHVTVENQRNTLKSFDCHDVTVEKQESGERGSMIPKAKPYQPIGRMCHECRKPYQGSIEKRCLGWPGRR